MRSPKVPENERDVDGNVWILSRRDDIAGLRCVPVEADLTSVALKRVQPTPSHVTPEQLASLRRRIAVTDAEARVFDPDHREHPAAPRYQGDECGEITARLDRGDECGGRNLRATPPPSP